MPLMVGIANKNERADGIAPGVGDAEQHDQQQQQAAQQVGNVQGRNKVQKLAAAAAALPPKCHPVLQQLAPAQQLQANKHAPQQQRPRA